MASTIVTYLLLTQELQAVIQAQEFEIQNLREELEQAVECNERRKQHESTNEDPSNHH